MTRPKPITGYTVAKRHTTAALKSELASGAKGEEALHIAIADVLRLSAKPGVIWWHCPNGGKRSRSEAARFKRMGVLAGVSDFQISLPNGRMAFMEVKTPRGIVSEAQEAFLVGMAANGHLIVIMRNLDEATRLLVAWDAIKPVRVA